LLLGAASGPGDTEPARAYLGDGKGGFALTPAGLISFPASVGDFVSGDLTGDGKLEIVYYQSNQPLTVLKQNDAGTAWIDVTRHVFGNQVICGGEEVVLADFNGDGRDD